MESANPLFPKGCRQNIQGAPSSPGSTGGGRSPLRGVLPHIGASPGALTPSATDAARVSELFTVNSG